MREMFKYLLDLDLQRFGGKKTDSEEDYDYGDPEDVDETEEEADNQDIEDDDLEADDEDDYVEEEDENEAEKSNSQKEEEKKAEKKTETDTKDDSSKKDVEVKKQDRDVNHEMAEKRRKEAEEKARKKAEREQYLTGFKAALGGKNPFTGEAIESDDDVLECELMLKAKEKGLDPIQDYHKMVKEYRKQETEKIAKAQAEQNEKQTWIKNDIAEFTKENPNVDLGKLFDDPDFKEFAEDLTGKAPLKTIYAKYQKIQSKIQTAKAETTTMKEARVSSSPGNLNSGGNTGDGTKFTTEQLKKMTPNQIKEHWVEIQKQYK